MVLLADIGNTTTVLGLTGEKSIEEVWRLPSSRIETEDELFVILDGLLRIKGYSVGEIDGLCVASVVPRLNRTINYFTRKYLPKPAVFLRPDRFFPLGLNTDNPAEIGADRLADVLGAKECYGNNVIVVDAGTAITIDIVKDGNFVGGAILPGPGTAMSALFSHTAKLPEVELFFEDHYFGTNTEDNLRIGIVNGTYFAIQGIIDNIIEKFEEKPTVVGTGGNIDLFLIEGGLIEIADPNLTLKGLSFYYNRVKPFEEDTTC
ncbi:MULTISPECIES: type III pantothenate kinase [Mesotoga]|jgi:type III pantothenate kinase|uniref:type III pantothenate kinase n=2 Tax=Kosmotogaceae TaxID=1643948 RepID=UPI0002CC4DE8|nr:MULTISPECIES: type III pantothenate kinase [Mesotoga]MCP5456558.1 type III pantothenate kinase [Thermotogota bacterium]CCU85824.1 Type III pantothenate kinase [Mesotoga infera]MCB1223332.1 type III pantothenate kinase [Mesotoga sp.]MCP5460519.1 type III pantothenate kinase [Thermotogota bacterium]MDK2943319.1 type pantothenate kinase [Mesotoga sp.]